MTHISVIEAPAVFRHHDDFWRRLKTELAPNRPEILILNELPFGSWIANGADYDVAKFKESERDHLDAIAQLSDLGIPLVIGTMPANVNDVRVNRGFLWREGIEGYCSLHEKQFFPDHIGYYESRWFSPGKHRFQEFEAAGLKCGLLICTDVMFNEWSRFYGRQGADLIIVPRATSNATKERWKTALSMAAIVSGCYVASSNRNGFNDHSGYFGGSGMIFSPRGELIAETTAEAPIAVCRIDRNLSREARKGYPCNVTDTVGAVFFTQFDPNPHP